MQTVTFEVHYSDGRPMDKADVVESTINKAWDRVKRAFPSAASIEFVSARKATADESRVRW